MKCLIKYKDWLMMTRGELRMEPDDQIHFKGNNVPITTLFHNIASIYGVEVQYIYEMYVKIDYPIKTDECVIKKKEYDELTEKEQFLYALEAAGVDNWDGYSIAQEIQEEWNNEDLD